MSARSYLGRGKPGRTRRTFQAYVGVWIELGGRHLGLLNAVVILAVDLVAFFVDQRRVAVDDGPPDTGAVDRLG